MTAAVLKFPTPSRVIESPRCPPLWQQVTLLQRQLALWPERFTETQKAIIARAQAIAMLGDDAPIDQQIEYLGHVTRTLGWHFTRAPIGYDVYPTIGAKK